MSLPDISQARPSRRTRREGMLRENVRSEFSDRMPPSAQRHIYIRRSILWKQAEPPVNPQRTEIGDPAAAAAELKRLARDMGADMVGVADLNPDIHFDDAPDRGHTHVIVFGMAMTYDCMIEIGPTSQDEVHRVYYRLDDLANRLGQHIAAYGYSARSQPNSGDFPLPAYGYLAGLGELGKHGSLLSPDFGSSFRLGAISTNMPLAADGPQDYGIDAICASCNVCERFCPGDAIKPVKQEKYGVTRWHVDTPACEPWFYKMYGCKICLMVCPMNARGALKEAYKPVAQDIRETRNAEGLVRLIEARSDKDYTNMPVPSDAPMEQD